MHHASRSAQSCSGKASRAEAEASAEAVTAALRQQAEQQALEDQEDAFARRLASMRRKLGPDGIQVRQMPRVAQWHRAVFVNSLRLTSRAAHLHTFLLDTCMGFVAAKRIFAGLP